MAKERFKQQLIDIMKESEVFKQAQVDHHHSDKEYNDTLDLRALTICRNADVPTLHKAVTTAAELKTWIQKRDDDTTVSNMQLLVLEGFVWQSHAKTRAFTSLKWLCDNVGLKWPVNQIEQPEDAVASGSLSMETNHIPAAQPLMYNQL